MNDITKNNSIALLCLAVAKLMGMAGMGMAYLQHRTIGFTMLVVSGLILLFIIAYSITNMRWNSEPHENS